MTERTAVAQREQRESRQHRAEIAHARISMHEMCASAFRLLIFSFAVFLPGVAAAQVSQSQQSLPEDEYTFKLNANMVILSATVLDRHDALVSGLVKDDFHVFENGVPQQIMNFSHEDIPVTVGILVDDSGSMWPKRNDVIAAAMAFARSSNPRDQMFVVSFNEHVHFDLPANLPFTDSRKQLQLALSNINPDGETALYDAIAAGLNHLKLGSSDKKVLIVISDGDDDASKLRLSQVLEMAKKSNAMIYTIGIFDEEEDENLKPAAVLRHFARVTGGLAFFPESSAELATICEKIARDIRNQYTLTYIPAIAPQDGGYRSIVVKASAPGYGRLTVLTRPGYFVTSGQKNLATRE